MNERNRAAGGKANTASSPTGGVAAPQRSALSLALLAENAERDYRIRYRTVLAAKGGATITDFTLVGTLELSALPSTTGCALGGVFNGRLEMPNSGDTELKKFEQAASKPFILDFSKNGRFTESLAEPGMPAYVARVWTALGEYLQVSKNEGERWQERETDAAGSYLASYERTGPFDLKKRKLRYDTLSTVGVEKYDIQRFDWNARFDRQTNLVWLKVEENIQADTSAAHLPVLISSTLLELDGEGASLSRPKLDWSKLRAVAVSTGSIVDEQRDLDRHHVLSGGMSLAESLSRLSTLDPTGDADERERAGRAFIALTGHLKRDPAALETVRARLKKSGPLTETLLAALRDASTPEAKRRGRLAPAALPAAGSRLRNGCSRPAAPGQRSASSLPIS